MVQERFTVKRDGLRINGLICRRENNTAKKSPVIIMSHGFTCNMYSCIGYCESICAEGYVCVLFSFCGGGNKLDTEEVKSDGASVDMTVSSEVADLTAVVEYIEKLDYVDAGRIILMGESQGGFVSGLTAAKLQEKIQKLIMIFPALCIPDHARMGCLGFAKYDPRNMPDSIDIGSTVIGRKLHDDVVKMDAIKEVTKFKGPVLIIHGDEDRVVDYHYSIKAKDAYAKDQCQLLIVNQMGHGVDEAHRELVIETIMFFLNK